MCVCKEEYESEFTGGRCENGVYEKGNGYRSLGSSPFDTEF